MGVDPSAQGKQQEMEAVLGGAAHLDRGGTNGIQYQTRGFLSFVPLSVTLVQYPPLDSEMRWTGELRLISLKVKLKQQHFFLWIFFLFFI